MVCRYHRSVPLHRPDSCPKQPRQYHTTLHTIDFSSQTYTCISQHLPFKTRTLQDALHLNLHFTLQAIREDRNPVVGAGEAPLVFHSTTWRIAADWCLLAIVVHTLRQYFHYYTFSGVRRTKTHRGDNMLASTTKIIGCVFMWACGIWCRIRHVHVRPICFLCSSLRKLTLFPRISCRVTRALFQRILHAIQQADPFYDHIKWAEEAQQNEKYLRNICTMPVRLREEDMDDEGMYAGEG